MKAVLQRVTMAEVKVHDQIMGEIENGLLVFLGVMDGDTGKEARWLSEKTAGLRIFSDASGKMNRSLLEAGGEALVISNFTLCADAKKGRRPSYIHSAAPNQAESLYLYFSDCLLETGVSKVCQGVFGADMQVSLINDGPVTILLDTDELMPGKRGEKQWL